MPHELSLKANPPRISLAPSLAKKGLTLPRYLLGQDWRTPECLIDLLESLNLTYEQAAYLVWHLQELREGEPKFEAVPRDPRIPFAPPPFQNLTRNDPEYDFHDILGLGIVHYTARIVFTASFNEIQDHFAVWLRYQRKLLRCLPSDKLNRSYNHFFRDLLIYELTRSGDWRTEDIEIQLKHMGLPKLGRSKTAEPKATKRKIVYRVKRLLARIRNHPLFT